MNDVWYFVVDAECFDEVKRFNTNSEAAEYLQKEIEDGAHISSFLVFKGDKLNLAARSVTLVEIGGI